MKRMTADELEVVARIGYLSSAALLGAAATAFLVFGIVASALSVTLNWPPFILRIVRVVAFCFLSALTCHNTVENLRAIGGLLRGEGRERQSFGSLCWRAVGIFFGIAVVGLFAGLVVDVYGNRLAGFLVFSEARLGWGAITTGLLSWVLIGGGGTLLKASGLSKLRGSRGGATLGEGVPLRISAAQEERVALLAGRPDVGASTMAIQVGYWCRLAGCCAGAAFVLIWVAFLAA